jgi:hypothetical protein
MHKPSRTHLTALALTLAVAVCILTVFAGVAAADPTQTDICSNCHGAAGSTPTVTVVSAPGADPVTYNVKQQSPAWAAYDLSDNLTRIAGGTSSDANFTAPAGHYVRVCASDGIGTGTFTQAYVLTPKLLATPHGTVSPAKATVVAPAGNQTFTFTPDSGYHVADVKINGTPSPAAVTAGSYQFTNVQADATIAVTFAANGFVISASAGPNGTISPLGDTTVTPGANQTYTMSPDTGFRLDTITVDGVVKAPTAANSYTFTNVTAAHTIAVTFKVAAPAKSTITVAVSGTLRAGKTATLKGTLKPAHAAKVTLTIQRKSGSRWVKVTTKRATASATTGAYKCAYKLPKKGSYRVQAVAAGTSAYAKATSSWRTFAVR